MAPRDLTVQDRLHSSLAFRRVFIFVCAIVVITMVTHWDALKFLNVASVEEVESLPPIPTCVKRQRACAPQCYSPIFVCGEIDGCSTLLMRLVNALPQISIVGESNAVDSLLTFYETARRTADTNWVNPNLFPSALNRDDLRHGVAMEPIEDARKYELDVLKMRKGEGMPSQKGRESLRNSLAWFSRSSSPQVREAVRKMMWTLFGPQHGCTRWGYKEIRCGRGMPLVKYTALMLEIFPDAKFIFAESCKASTARIDQKAQFHQVVKDGAKRTFLLLDLQNLVGNVTMTSQDQELRRVASFLGVNYTKEVEKTLFEELNVRI